jgi:hypothetical protein
VRWQLPDGVRAGEIVWPAPERIPAGTLVNYGYSNGVVLPVPLTIARGVAGRVTVGLQVKWLVCQELCVPGQARLELKLPLGAAEKAEVSGWKRLIDQARAREPQPAPAAWNARAASQKDDFVITIDTGAREQGVFPIEVARSTFGAAAALAPPQSQPRADAAEAGAKSRVKPAREGAGAAPTTRGCDRRTSARAGRIKVKTEPVACKEPTIKERWKPVWLPRRSSPPPSRSSPRKSASRHLRSPQPTATARP